jgi:L-threonylcarbamoyladenylate synthase
MTAEPSTRTLSADASAIAEAARGLGSGGLVAFPTETVYGLGADATNGEAVARLYAAKGRPQFNPLIAHVYDLATAGRLAEFDDVAEQLAAAFWPGPLTLVLPKTVACDVSDLALAGLDTIVDSTPTSHGPPSTIRSMRPRRSASTCTASVGDTWPERLAEGATIGLPNAASRSRAI